MEQEKQELHVYVMAVGLLHSNRHLTKKQLELLLTKDSEKYSLIFSFEGEMSKREKFIRDIFLAYRLCYIHLLSLYETVC